MNRYPFDPSEDELASAEKMLGPVEADSALFVIGYVESALDEAAEPESQEDRDRAVRRARAMLAAWRVGLAGAR